MADEPEQIAALSPSGFITNQTCFVALSVATHSIRSITNEQLKSYFTR